MSTEGEQAYYIDFEVLKEDGKYSIRGNNQTIKLFVELMEAHVTKNKYVHEQESTGIQTKN